MLTLEMFTAVQIMRPFCRKRLSCVSKHNQTRAMDDEEFNCISSSLLHWLLSRHPTVTHIPRWSFSPAPGAYTSLQVSAQPQACAWGTNTGRSCNPSEELSFYCSCIKDRAWKKFKSNSKECYICYQLCTRCLVVTCTDFWVEKTFFLRGLSLDCIFRQFAIKFVINLCHSIILCWLCFIYLLCSISLAGTCKCTEFY